MRLLGFIIAVFSGFLVVLCVAMLFPANPSYYDPASIKVFGVIMGVLSAISFRAGWRLLKGTPASGAPLASDRDSDPGGAEREDGAAERRPETR